jgi:hypothetical protein
MFVKSPQGDSAEDQLLVQFQGMIAEYERRRSWNVPGAVSDIERSWAK